VFTKHFVPDRETVNWERRLLRSNGLCNSYSLPSIFTVPK